MKVNLQDFKLIGMRKEELKYDLKRIKAWLKKTDSSLLSVKIIAKEKILHHLWECDGFIWIVEGKKKASSHKETLLISTNHGEFQIMHKEELLGKISEYIDLASKYAKMLEIL